MTENSEKVKKDLLEINREKIAREFSSSSSNRRYDGSSMDIVSAYRELRDGGHLSDREVELLISMSKGSYSELDSAQKRVKDRVSSNDSGPEVATASIITIIALIKKALSGINRAREVSERLSNEMDNPPQYVSDEDKNEKLNDLLELTEKIRGDITYINRRINQFTPSSKIDSIDQGIENLNSRIAPFSVNEDEFDTPPQIIGAGDEYHEASIRRFATRTIGERSYELLDNTNTSLTPSGGVRAEFKLVDDSGQGVVSATGHVNASVVGDKIVLKGEPEGLGSVELSMKIVNDSDAGVVDVSNLRYDRRLRFRIDQASNDKDRVKQTVDELSDQFGFELWACLILDLFSVLKQVWSEIEKSLRGAIRVFKFSKNIVTGRPYISIADVGNSLFGSSAVLSGILEAIVSPSNVMINALNLRSSFINPGGLLMGSSAACGFNKAKYCDIRDTLSRMLRNLLVDMDRFGLDIGQINLDDIGYDLSNMFNLMNAPFRFLEGILNDIDGIFFGKIEKEICKFIEERLKGKPKVVSGFTGILIGMIPQLSLILFSAMSSQSFSGFDREGDRSNDFTDIADELERNGFKRAASELREGRVDKFLKMQEGEETSEGAMSSVIDDAINSNVPINLKSYLFELQQPVAEVAARKYYSGKVRSFMVNSSRNMKSMEESENIILSSWINGTSTIT